MVLETSYGMLVERLLDAGYTVVPVNPDLVARRRGPARKKDDAEDARIACLIALDRFERLRPLVPHGEAAAELRAIARDDERAARDERRLLNRLRADLIATFPAALEIAGDDMGAPTFLRLLERWPTARRPGRGLARRARRPSPAPATTAGRNGSPTRSQAALAAEQLRGPRLAGAGQGRHHPPGRHPAARPRRRSAAPGNGAWANCCSAPPATGRGQPTQGQRPGAGGPWRRDLPELSRPR